MAEKAKATTSNKTVKKQEKAVKPAAKVAAPKKSAKAVDETVAASSVVAEVKKRTHGDVKVDVYSAKGTADGSMTLPEAVFAAKVNKPLMAQAVRVYLANQREGSAATKTRSEVDGSSKKIYKQKGTGRARHGTIRAPIFVKGGVALGPKPRDYSLDLSKKMKKAALASAFTSQLLADSVRIVGDLKSLELKTKVFASLFKNLGTDRRTLMVLSKEEKDMTRAIRNIENIDVLEATYVHTYAVLRHKHVVLTKQAVKDLETMYAEPKE